MTAATSPLWCPTCTEDEAVAAEAVAAAIVRRQGVLKRRKVGGPHFKFEAQGPVAERRRKSRVFMRGFRAKRAVTKKPAGPRPQTQRQGQRNIGVHCCGARPENCKCFLDGRGAEIAAAFDHARFDVLAQGIGQSRVFTWLDTDDLTALASQIPWRNEMSFSWLFPVVFTWRHFSNAEFWEGVVARGFFFLKQKCGINLINNKKSTTGAISLNTPPDFLQFERVLRDFDAKKVTPFGGVFYHGNVLSSFRYSTNDDWQDTDCFELDPIENCILALKVLWHVASTCKDDFDSLQDLPTRAKWLCCTRDFHVKLQAHTKGIFGPYSMKIAFDGILMIRPQLHFVLSWIPMPSAYQTEIPTFYTTEISQDELWLTACHFHRQMKMRFRRMTILEGLAQLCWKKRGVCPTCDPRDAD